MAPAPLVYCRECDRLVRARGGVCARCAGPLVPYAEAFPEGSERRAFHERRPPAKGSVGLGLSLSLLLHVLVQGIVLSLVRPAWDSFFLAIGLTQILYLLPLTFVFVVRGERRTVSGVLIAMAITLLLNALCWGVGLATFAWTY